MYPDHLSYLVGSGHMIAPLATVAINLTLPRLADDKRFVKDLRDNIWTHLVFPTYIDTIYVSGWVEIPLEATHFVFPKQRFGPCYLIGRNINNQMGSPTKINSTSQTCEEIPYFIVANRKILLNELTYYIVELCTPKRY